jgi:hypothetical protein
MPQAARMGEGGYEKIQAKLASSAFYKSASSYQNSSFSVPHQAL